MIYLGADHRGYELKEIVKEYLEGQGTEVEDVGAHGFDPDDDYFDFGVKVAESIEGDGGGSRGILLCGSGHGVDIVANRFPKVRAIIGFNDEVVVQGREHEDANVLVLPSDWMDADMAVARVRLFLETEFSKESRHIRRIAKLSNIQISNKG
jgi:RpiB/LacA/LacB family sugar-phosphate isomerase